MKMLDLFAGIGGFSLAGHWMGWETVAFVEWDKFNQKVLAKNFPGIPIHGDIREFDATQYNGTIDIITGGFPCQPFSKAGKQNGRDDDRYLWPEMFRIVREVQPAWVVAENVGGIYDMDDGSIFEEVCANLESLDYKVQPFRIPAIATGAPHRRDRWWFVANKSRRDYQSRIGATDTGHTRSGAITGNIQQQKGKERLQQQYGVAKLGQPGEVWDFTNTNCKRLEEWESQRRDSPKEQSAAIGAIWKTHWFEAATRLCRVDDGLPTWMDSYRKQRIKALGNAIVPQVAFEIFKSLTT